MSSPVIEEITSRVLRLVQSRGTVIHNALYVVVSGLRVEALFFEGIDLFNRNRPLTKHDLIDLVIKETNGTVRLWIIDGDLINNCSDEQVEEALFALRTALILDDLASI